MTMIGLGDSHDSSGGGIDGGDAHDANFGGAHGTDLGGAHGADFGDASGLQDGIDIHDGFSAHDGLNAQSGLDAHDVQDTHDFHPDSNTDGFKFFTIRGIVAFFSIFGWTGSAMVGSANPIMTFVVAFLAGLAAMTLVGLAFYAILQLQSKGNLDYRYSIGTQGEVYIPIPKQRSGMGKVNVVFQERLVEADAVTDEEEKMETGTRIRVVGLLGNNVLLISKDWEGYKQNELHNDSHNENSDKPHDETLQLPKS